MTISRIVRLCAAPIAVAFLAACAHPITVGAEKTPERVESQLIQKKVAYAMNDADRAKQVTTEGGGGDRISYFPYKDLEKAIRDALRSVYSDVTVVRSAADLPEVGASGAVLVFTPVITTTSSSSSALTWPPTAFTSALVCRVTDASGQEVAQVRASGSGAAEFSEFKHNFGLAANRAGSDLAGKLGEDIRQNAKLR